MRELAPALRRRGRRRRAAALPRVPAGYKNGIAAHDPQDQSPAAGLNRSDTLPLSRGAPDPADRPRRSPLTPCSPRRAASLRRAETETSSQAGDGVSSRIRSPELPNTQAACCSGAVSAARKSLRIPRAECRRVSVRGRSLFGDSRPRRECPTGLQRTPRPWASSEFTCQPTIPRAETRGQALG